MAVAAVALAALGWLVIVYPDTPGPGRGAVVEVEIAGGAALSDVSRDLATRGALANPRVWALYARVLGAGPRLRAGRVLVRDSMRPREILQRVAAGYGPVQVRLTFPEGFDRFDFARELERWGIVRHEAFLRATEDARALAALGIRAPTCEGYLFPDTYVLADDTDPARLVRRFVDNARRRTREALDPRSEAMRRLARDLGWGAHEVITLASIVEKEARVSDERPLIAGVFFNRLTRAEFRPKRLQADPTVAYGCRLRPDVASCRAFDGRRVVPSMLDGADNPYNTYRHDGLPPGPIANPGLGALLAVLSPATHAYYYFVAAGGGRHVFSATLEEHQAAIARVRGE